MLSEGITALLKGDPAVSGMVGGRVFPVTTPPAVTLPAVTYHVVGGSSDPGLSTSGMQKVRVQFDVFSESYKAASAVREAIRRLLNGYIGQLGDGTFLLNVELIQGIDFFEQDPREFRCMSEFYFYFNFID